MSARLTGVPIGLIEQPGWVYNVNSAGLFTLKTQFVCRAEDIIDLSPPIGSEHSRFRFATLDEITGAREEGDLAKIDCIYKGIQPSTSGGDDGSKPVFQQLSSTREEPIETHPMFKSLSMAELAIINDVMEGRKTYDEGKALLQTDSEAGIKLLEKKLRGQQSYLRRATVWRETTTSSSGFGSVSEVGKINNPPGSAPSNASGNWILLSIDEKQQGKAWERVREWMASGDEKWDEDLYA